MHYLGKNIKFLRKKLGKNQADIGSYVNKGHTTIGNWEKGESEPNLKELILIANLFEISIDDILLKDISGISGASSNSSEDRFSRQLKIDKPADTMEEMAEKIEVMQKEIEELKKKINKLSKD